MELLVAGAVPVEAFNVTDRARGSFVVGTVDGVALRIVCKGREQETFVAACTERASERKLN